MRKPDHLVYGKNQEKKETDQKDLQILKFGQKSLYKLGLWQVCFLKRFTLLKKSQIFEIELMTCKSS